MSAFKLRKRDKRRLLIGGSVVLGVTGILFFALPQLVKGRVESAVHDRTGLSLTIDHAGLGLSSVTLSGVAVRSADGRSVSLDVQEAEVEVGMFAALWKGAGAVTNARVKGVDGDVDIASPDFAKLREKLASREPASDPSTPRTHRELRLEQFHMSVKQGSDEILAADGGEVRAGQTELNATLTHVRLTQPRLAVAEARDVDVVFDRQGSLRLKSARVADALVSITPDGLRRVRGKDRPAEDDDSNPDPAAPAAAVKEEGERGGSLQALLAKLAPGAEISLGRATFEQVDGAVRTPVLKDVEAKIRLESDNAIRVTGRGDSNGGGKLDTDMRVWLKDLRADGKVTLSSLPLTLLVPLLPSVPWFEPQNSKIDAALTIRAESPARVALEGKAALHNAGLSSERIATTPVRGIEASIEGRGYWMPLARRLEITSGGVGLGKASASVKGAVELDADHFAFDIDAVLPQTQCTDAIRSIPKDLLGDMALAQWDGTIGAKFRFQTDSRDLDKTVLDVDIKDRCNWLIVPVLADLSRFSGPFTHTVEEPDGKVFEMETGPGTAAWTPIEAMSPYFVHAVLVHEDPQFFSHHGFSLINIRNAVVRDLKERRYAVGASTITMQLVKNVFLHREKTLARKIQEVLLTWWTERVMEKKDIIELYFNVIEYGPSIYGIRAAAQHYWNRLPSELSPAESVFLATILPNPKKYHSYYDKNALTASWMSQMRGMMKRMGDRGAYDAKAVEYGMSEIDHFKFAKDGSAAAPRVIPGSAAALPYMPGPADTGAGTDLD